MAGSVSVMVTMHEGGGVEGRYPEDEVVCRYLMDKGRAMLDEIWRARGEAAARARVVLAGPAGGGGYGGGLIEALRPGGGDGVGGGGVGDGRGAAVGPGGRGGGARRDLDDGD